MCAYVYVRVCMCVCLFTLMYLENGRLHMDCQARHEQEAYSMAVPMIPVVMTGTKNASCFFSALHHGKMPAFIDGFCTYMGDRSLVAQGLREPDKGAQCDRLLTHEGAYYSGRQKIDPRTADPMLREKAKLAPFKFGLYYRHLCALHQGQLDIGNICKQRFLELIAGKYALAGLMNGGFFCSRITLGVEHALRQQFAFLVDPSPPSLSLDGNVSVHKSIMEHCPTDSVGAHWAILPAQT